ncbi:hypothetical protein [Eoetvoesiella caeni]
MSLPSDDSIEQAIPSEPNYIKHDAPQMFEEATRRAVIRNSGAVCANPFMDFVQTTADVAYGVVTILSMANRADLERMAHESGSETQPFLNDYDKEALLCMAKATIAMLANEAYGLADWSNKRVEEASHGN